MKVDFIKTRLEFDSQKLAQDVQACLDNNLVIRHNWQCIALQSNAQPATSGSESRSTIRIDENSNLEKIIRSFHCELESVRLLRLSPGNFIYENCKEDFQYENGYLRLHIPIQTNPKVSHRINDQLIFMKPGECWYMAVNASHSVSNNGTTDRIHLVIDAKRNAWTDAILQNLQQIPNLATKSRKESEELEYAYKG